MVVVDANHNNHNHNHNNSHSLSIVFKPTLQEGTASATTNPTSMDPSPGEGREADGGEKKDSVEVQLKPQTQQTKEEEEEEEDATIKKTMQETLSIEPKDKQIDTATATASDTTATATATNTIRTSLDETDTSNTPEVSNLPQPPSLTADSDAADFSMGIYSMDQPLKTPLLLPSLDFHQTPKLGEPDLPLLKASTPATRDSTVASTIEDSLKTPLQCPESYNELNNNELNHNEWNKTNNNPSLLFHSDAESSTIGTLDNSETKTKTLAALFGGPHAPYDQPNPLAVAQHDYTLVGDSPYETTYDPQSKFYYNRVYGQLYITTISVMFRGKAFGPIGAIPYERRLLLPFLEISEIDAYKTTSLKITMNDGESYVFKSFPNRDAMVKLLRRTRKKCCETQRQRRHTTSIVPSSDIHPTPVANNRSLVDNRLEATIEQQQHKQKQQQQKPRRSRTPTSVDQQEKSQERPRRSQSMPSSLRAKTPRSLPKSLTTTPQRNSVFFDAQTTPQTKSIQTPAPRSQPVPVGSLRLSLQEDGQETKSLDDLNPPRRLFEVEPSAMVAANAAAAAVMLSPPRTTISQRKQPKTPHVETPAAKPNPKHESSALASIPAIPTVPSLNTPEPSTQQRNDTRTHRSMPLPIPEMANDEPMTPSPEDDMVKTAWKSIVSAKPKDWTIALEATKLPNCTLDEWFTLFFSDEAVFSLARYQLEHVGDRDVSVSPWTKKQTKNDEKKSELDDNLERMVHELERQINYIHPIKGSMVGPSEAETFRTQTLKRYRNHGAILRNVTTVGKGVPMNDSFRVEDQWIIENDDHHTLTISVAFRVTFLKRCMFKSMIQKNTLSETKKWFMGYKTMLQTALHSPQLQELRKRRADLQESASPLSSAPSLSLSMRETSGKDSISLLRHELHDSPQSSLLDGHYATEQTKQSKSLLWTVGAVLVVVVIGLLLLTILALWSQVRSVGTSLLVVETKLSELQVQNTMLLQRLEELAAAAIESKQDTAMPSYATATTTTTTAT